MAKLRNFGLTSQDRYMKPDIDAATNIVRRGEVIKIVEDVLQQNVSDASFTK